METPKVTDREKEMYGEDAARYTSGYNAYMQEKENAETPQQLETIEKRLQSNTNIEKILDNNKALNIKSINLINSSLMFLTQFFDIS